MTKAAAARRLAAAAAYGGGGVSALGGALYGVLRIEAQLARKAIGPRLDETPPDSTGLVRPRPPRARRSRWRCSATRAPPGYGVDRVEETPGAQLASGLAERADRRVHLRGFAEVGARSSDLAGQVDRALAVRPDVAVILIGVNDVTHQVLPAAVGAQPGRGRLAGCSSRAPRSSSAPAPTSARSGRSRPRSSRWRGPGRAGSRPRRPSRWSRRAAGPSRWAPSSGPEFDAAPALLFGPDRFHPSADGYRSLADVLLPSVLAALGLVREEEVAPEADRGEGVLPVATAAVQAVETPGTELDGTEVGGARRGVRGLWVELRHRRREATSPATAPTDRAGRRSRNALTRPKAVRAGQRWGCGDQSWLKIARMRSRLV